MVALTGIRDALKTGIYTPREAATYAGIPTQTMTRWLFGNTMGNRVLDAQFAAADQKFVSFLDFVQALAVRDIKAVIARRQVTTPLKIFFDENFSHKLAKCMADLLATSAVRPIVPYYLQRYPEGVADPDWIPAIAAEGFILVSTDRAK